MTPTVSPHDAAPLEGATWAGLPGPAPRPRPWSRVYDSCVQLYSVAAACTLVDLGALRAIPSNAGLSVGDLSQKTGVAPEVLERLLRLVGSVGMLNEVDPGVWAHTMESQSLEEGKASGMLDMIAVFTQDMLPPVLSMSRLGPTANLGSAVDPYKGSLFSRYHGAPDKTFWEMIRADKERSRRFDRGLAWWNSEHHLTRIFPFAQVLSDGNRKDRPLMVDVGGGWGAALREVRAECPHLKGPLILQDLPEVLATVGNVEKWGIEKMPHDFFQEQPVMAAQVYYLRRVLHDWQRDEDVATVLCNVKCSMAADSRILVSELVLPNTAAECDSKAAYMDVMMMSIGGKERTENDWRRIGVSTGLNMRHIWRENNGGHAAVIEYVLGN